MATSTIHPDICLYTGGGINGNQAVPLLWEHLKHTAWTTLVLWCVNVDRYGNFDMNGDMAFNGVVPYDSRVLAGQINALRSTSSGDGNVRRVGISFGSSTFSNIQQYYGVNDYFTRNFIRNLSALKLEYQLDFLDYDDEQVYDLNVNMILATLAKAMGLKITICPYTEQSFWSQFVVMANTVNPGLCSSIFLQCYSGGGANTPLNWASVAKATGINITPGLWATTSGDGSTPSDVTTTLKNWANDKAPMAGGFMFCGTEMVSPYTKGPLGSPKEYATAIQNAFP